ncbi:hypothetical protein KCU91_g101, partial [Aureobasidium melanogenum]
MAAPAFEIAEQSPIICPRMAVGKLSEDAKTTVDPGPTSPSVRKTPYMTTNKGKMGTILCLAATNLV